jgi:hypothetical protein
MIPEPPASLRPCTDGGTASSPHSASPPSQLQVPSFKLRIRNPPVEAEACFQKAIEIARQQQAKSWELRATVSLARLWQQQGKIAEARQMLAKIYNWFTEGFDTTDLREAKVLLDELV